MIKALVNPDFFPALIQAIDGATRSIVLVNYLANFSGEKNSNDPVRKIARALVRAVSRGVAVRVFLEGSKFENNYPFFRYLKDRKVDVWLDTSRTFIHEKVLMADDASIIVGSHNLTRASFEMSEEISVLTDEAGVIKSFKKSLEKISAQRVQIKAGRSDDNILLPAEFVKRVSAPLLRAHAGFAFNLYLIFCGEGGALHQTVQGGGRAAKIPINEEKWGRALGLSPSEAGAGTTKRYRRYYFEQRINRFLGQLKKMALIEVDRRLDIVKRADLNGGGSLKVERRFWTDGWFLKLSFPAKHFYFISILETLDSPFYPWWSLSVRRLRKKYGCDHSILKGALELESAGILEILKGQPVRRGNSYSEEAQYYRLNPLKAASKASKASTASKDNKASKASTASKDNKDSKASTASKDNKV